MNKAVIQVSNLTYSYPGANKPTLKNISFEVNEGEFVLLIGASGSGKSTLIQCLNGIIPKIKGGDTSGEILVSGMDVAEHRVQELASKIGIIFQDPESQLCSLFIKDEVAFGPENFKMDRDEILGRVGEALAYVGLQNAEKKYVYEISGGQQQRLAISSVLAMEPEILALDDPTANLDPVGTDQILRVLAKMREQNKTILLATPLLDEFIHLATRIIVLNEGTLFADGDPREVMDKFGLQLRDRLGVWIPQMVEIELGLRSRGISENRGNFMPISPEETYSRYKDLTFCPRTSNKSVEESPDSVIRVNDVTFSYPDGTQALKNVSFDIGKGRLTAILGPNGSGKSTVAKLIIGLLPIKEGNVEVCGLNVRTSKTSDITRKVGFVFQNPEHQFVRDTVRKEIAYSLQVLGKSEDEVNQGVAEMLKLFELEDFAERHPFGLSGGQKRRLSVATMLIGKPELLILDEPTYGQDYRNVKAFMQLVKDQINHGISIVMITHSMRLVQEFADDIVVIRFGSIDYVGSPEKLWECERITQDDTLKPPPLQELIKLMRDNGNTISNDVRRVQDFVETVI